MARQGRRSLLRRRGAPVGALAVLCVVLAVPARAATPSPDPPPNAVTPEPPPVTRTQPAPVRSAPVSTSRSAPVVRSAPRRSSRAQSGAGAGDAKPKPRRKPKPVVREATALPSRSAQQSARPRPRAARSASSSVDELNRGLLAFAGVALLLVRAGRRAFVLVAAPTESMRLKRSWSWFCLPSLVALTRGTRRRRTLSFTTCAPRARGVPELAHSQCRDLTGSSSRERTQVKVATREPVTTEGHSRLSSVHCQRVADGPDDVYPRTITVRHDATPPQVTAMTPSRPADSGAWYRSTTRRRCVRGRGCDVRDRVVLESLVLGRRTAPPLPSPERAPTLLETPAHQRAVAFKYDATPPTVSPSVDRPPDGKGWYRKPVTVSFAGTDARPGSRPAQPRRATPGRISRKPQSSDRAATRPGTRPRPARRSSTTRRPRRSRRRRPRSTRVSRASAGSAPATSSKSSSSAARASTARSRRSSTEATALRSSTRP